jgi:glycogen debranching enzyme GlgX
VSKHPALVPGKPWPLGATWDGHGVNFAVVSAHAKSLDLCLFDALGESEISRTPLPGHSHDVWHGYLEGAAPGLIYGYRAHGLWRPQQGQRFNAHKLLLDPYARDIVGRFEWREEHLGADPQHPHHADARDNAAFALKARIVDSAYDWGGDTQPHTPLADTVLYELHVKGFTKLHPGVPEALRGSYAGLAHDAAISHLKRLGVTAVSLLTVHMHLDEQRLTRLGLSNYWGYNTIGFFCAEPRWASGVAGLSPRDEFRSMVKRLHQAGIEVILDVVYNHTAESDELGPNLSFRGLDNSLYYRLQPQHRSHYENHTGCGNTLDLREPRVLQLVMDSLRYWAGEMHVDGFRFDLAPVLGRTDHGFDKRAPFFAAIAQDPLLSRLKMIAEPWDVGPGGYQLGGFPRGWLEWNDRFRDTMRSFWVEQGSNRGDFAQRLCASSATFQAQGRAPAESVNYCVSHDGFTLRDLVSYGHKHNLANAENNRDGHGHNHNHNCGVEGPSDDAAVNTLRGKLQRALLATQLLAQGTPMLAAGDELGHTQGGNNNPYCQDNQLTWIAWDKADADLIAFTQRVLALRRELLPLGAQWYEGRADAAGVTDLAWQRADGLPLHGDDWRPVGQSALACLIGKPGRASAPLLWLINGSTAPVQFKLPAGHWQLLLDTSHTRGLTDAPSRMESSAMVAARSMLLLGVEGGKI